MRHLRVQKEIHLKILQINRVQTLFLVQTWTKFCEFFCSKVYDKARSFMLRIVNFPMKNKKLVSSFEIVSFCHTLNMGENELDFLLVFNCCAFLILCSIQPNWSKVNIDSTINHKRKRRLMEFTV